MSKRKNRRLMGQMNVVPYIDVMLVLLIIFMVTAPMLQQGIVVDLPEVDAAPIDPEFLQNNEPLILSFNAAGEMFLNLDADPEAAVDIERVLSITAAIVRSNPDTPVLVQSDRNVPFGIVVAGMATLQSAGATSVGILSEPPESEQE